MRAITILAGTFLLTSCAADEAMAEAQSGVARFHQQLNQASYAEIYAATHPALKKAATETNFTKLLQAVHDKLGNLETSKRVGWTVNYATQGRSVTLTQDSQYQRGKAREIFVFIGGKGDVRLAGYHVNSNDLLTQ